jgi:hypothetical protein
VPPPLDEEDEELAVPEELDEEDEEELVLPLDDEDEEDEEPVFPLDDEELEEAPASWHQGLPQQG